MSMFPKKLHNSSLKCGGPSMCPDCRKRKRDNNWDDFWVKKYNKPECLNCNDTGIAIVYGGSPRPCSCDKAEKYGQ